MEKSHSASIGTDMAYFYSSPSLIYMLWLKLSSKNSMHHDATHKIILCILLILQYGGAVLFMIWYKQVFPAWDMKGAEMGQNKYPTSLDGLASISIQNICGQASISIQSICMQRKRYSHACKCLFISPSINL